MTLLNGTMTPIQTVTVGAGGQSAIEFTNIPQTYTDLCIMSSIRGNQDNGIIYYVRFNGDSGSNYSYRYMLKDSSSPTVALGSANSQNALLLGIVGGASPTSSTFSNDYLYIPNYTNSSIKSVSADIVMENNSTMQWMSLASGLWNSTAAINSIRIFPNTNIWIEGSSATLYGVKNYAATKIDEGAKASGGIVTSDATYWYHTFTTSGTFRPAQSINADILVVAGGGGGFSNSGTGGAGAGGLLGFTGQSLTSQNYTVTVGAGGNSGSNGSNSQFGSLTACIGGGASNDRGSAGSTGGSGGGGSSTSTGNGTVVAGGAGTAGQGNAGGSGQHTSNVGEPGGGGGGAGGAGENGVAGNATLDGDGGIGSSLYSSWGQVTGYGENVGGTYYFAGGGPGFYSAVGGFGGGGTSTTGRTGTRNGLSNTGGGGGSGLPGGGSGGSGGSGIVIVRYPK